MSIIQSIWALLPMLGILILIHELGHYWAARYFDVHIDSFSIGFGPRIFGFRRGETDFRVSLIPLGGYVKMEGEQPGEAPTEDPRAFVNKPRHQRLVIALAGPVMNILLAFVVVTGMFMNEFPRPVGNGPRGLIDMVAPNSAAARAGLQAGDRIVALDGQRDPSWEDIELKALTSPGITLDVEYVRNGQTRETKITPEIEKKEGAGIPGWRGQSEQQIAAFSEDDSPARDSGLKRGDVLVTVNGEPIRSITKLREIAAASGGQPVEVVYLRKDEATGTMREGRLKFAARMGALTKGGEKVWRFGMSLGPRVELVQLPLFEAMKESYVANLKYAGVIYRGLKNIAIAKISPKQLSGPIGIAAAAGEAAERGLRDYIEMLSGVSLNLALFNLLPIPVLDGGTILLLLVEMIRRRDLPMTAKETVMKLGFAFLMMLVIFVFYNDIRKTMGG